MIVNCPSCKTQIEIPRSNSPKVSVSTTRRAPQSREVLLTSDCSQRLAGPDTKRIAGLYIAWLVGAVMLIFAVTGRHPYSFYTFLRWICCAVFVYSTFAAHKKNRVLWVWIFGGLAVLYNPIFHVHLDRSTWASVNWLTLGAIAVATVFFGHA